ncbi:MAG: endo-1,4-beta-xylanase [Bacteroidetes bacterium]|nr:endo-1,4-beta-xylanase [Bacteroidota bacterium]
MRSYTLSLLLLLITASALAQPRWSADKANAWYKQYPWLVGCNFTPAYAINELEMWQADTFDTTAIDHELKLAQSIGMNMMRVFLHDLLWKQDPQGFKKRIGQFLAIADRHHIKILFVLFDSCWDPYPKSGKQHAPTPHVHNSGWVQSPGRKVLENLPANEPYLEGYVKGILTAFKDDKRILAWDLVNEADNKTGPSYEKVESPKKPELGVTLLKYTFKWAKAANPSQPLTAAPWLGDWSDTAKMKEMDKVAFYNSDIITFHNYDKPDDFAKRVKWTKVFNRPVICTEYMARPTGSTFQNILPICKANRVGACNWGLVDGKTQTKYPWDSWTKKYTSAPPLWFHEIFNSDGTPYKKEETEFIRNITGR